MSERSYNPEDLGFLISRELDGDLSEVERRCLEEAIRASDELGEDARAYAAADRLIRCWAMKKPELDWEATAGLTQVHVAGAGEDDGLHQVDALLQRWGASQANFTHVDLADGVLQQIRKEQGQVPSRSLIFRLRVPLAAAAAIALAVIGTTWFAPVGGPMVHVAIRTAPVMGPAAGEAPRATVSFARGVDAASVVESLPPSIGFLTLGAEAGAGEALPL